jgi:hypothetical protein
MIQKYLESLRKIKKIKMDGIYQTNDSFDFRKLTLVSPSVSPGGNYFIKFRINESPLYIQPPKCKTKQSIIKSGKRMYCDLMFSHENEDFIRWMENLENYCLKIIYENRARWFETELEEEDIENSFTSPLKLFKSGKYYVSRTNVPMYLGRCALKIYNEYEQEVSIESIQENTDVITILEIQGIKCSPKNFQIEMEIKQMMQLQPRNLFEKCILKRNIDTREIEESKHTSVSQYSSSNTNEGLDNALKNVDLKTEYIETTEEPVFNHPNTDPCSLSLGKNSSEYSDTLLFSPNEELTAVSNFTDSINIEKENECPFIEKVKEEEEQEKEPILENIEVSELLEINLDLDKVPENEKVQIKQRNDIYYQMYREAKRKAKLARDLALSSYLEAKRIKNTYMIEDVEDSDSDLEEDTFGITNLENKERYLYS